MKEVRFTLKGWQIRTTVQFVRSGQQVFEIPPQEEIKFCEHRRLYKTPEAATQAMAHLEISKPEWHWFIVPKQLEK